MLSKVFSSLLILILLFNVKFSSQTDIVSESKCNDKCEPARYTLYNEKGERELTAVFRMESTNAFEPIMSLELMDHPPYGYAFSNSLIFEYELSYGFLHGCQQLYNGKKLCRSGLSSQFEPSNCTIDDDTHTCKWLIKVGMDGLIENGKAIEASSMIITQSNTEIVLSTLDSSKSVTNNLTDLPLYHWSYARCCEYNKKVYDIDDGMITLKKDEDSFELFIYRFNKDQVKKPEQVTLIDSKKREITISCDGDKNHISVSTKAGLLVKPILDKYIFRKHIDRLRCGISLPIEMEGKYSSFSFNDEPLKLVYKLSDSYNIMAQVKFGTDSIDKEKPEIETTTLPASVNENQDIESTTSTASVDQQVVDENQEQDAVNPLIGVFLTIVTVVKSYFDLW